MIKPTDNVNTYFEEKIDKYSNDKLKRKFYHHQTWFNPQYSHYQYKR